MAELPQETINNIYKKGKADGIDEFVKECVEFEDLTFNKEHIQRIKMIAEQLKEMESGNNGTME